MKMDTLFPTEILRIVDEYVGDDSLRKVAGKARRELQIMELQDLTGGEIETMIQQLGQKRKDIIKIVEKHMKKHNKQYKRDVIDFFMSDRFGYTGTFEGGVDSSMAEFFAGFFYNKIEKQIIDEHCLLNDSFL